MLPDYYDGPSHALSEVINNSNGYAPSTWKDNRILTEKWLLLLIIKFIYKFSH